MNDFHPYAPENKYVQNEENTCVFSSLDSYLFAVNEHVEENSVLK